MPKADRTTAERLADLTDVVYVSAVTGRPLATPQDYIDALAAIRKRLGLQPAKFTPGAEEE